MVHILLLILKVLGITLLILLGLILLLVILLLIVPFCYSVDAEYYGDIKAVARVRWLCFVLDLKGMYGNQKFLYYLKSFGFTISTNDETDKHYRKGLVEEEPEASAYERKSGRKTSEKQEDEEFSKIPVRIVEDDFPEYSESYEKKPDMTEKKLPSDTESIAQEPKLKFEPEPEMEPAPERKSIFTKIREKIEQGMEWITTIPMRIHYKISEILTRILDFLANITENIRKLSQKREMIEKKLHMIRRFLERDTTKKAWKDILKYLKQTFRHVRPKKYHGMIHFGLEDPSATGQILGAAGVLLPIYRNHIVVTPDFEQQIFEGELSAKGRIQTGYFVILAIKVLLNRNLVKTIMKAKSIIGGNK